jgi:hypothetical protein
MGGSITGEAPEGRAACSQVNSAAFSNTRRTIVQVQDRIPHARFRRLTRMLSPRIPRASSVLLSVRASTRPVGRVLVDRRALPTELLRS